MFIGFTTQDEVALDATCVSWDFRAAGICVRAISSFYAMILLKSLGRAGSYLSILYTDGFGNWTDRGCNTTLNRDSGTVTCQCNHLTNFAALVVSLKSIQTLPSLLDYCYVPPNRIYVPELRGTVNHQVVNR